MNTFKASALSAKGRRAILDEAEKDGVIILRCNTNGDVLSELVLCSKDKYMGINNIAEVLKDFAEWWGVDGYMEGDKITDVISDYIKKGSGK